MRDSFLSLRNPWAPTSPVRFGKEVKHGSRCDTDTTIRVLYDGLGQNVCLKRLGSLRSQNYPSRHKWAFTRLYEVVPIPPISHLRGILKKHWN